MKRKTSRRTRSFHGNQTQSPTIGAGLFPKSSPNHSRSASEASSTQGQFPEAPNDVNDWIYRRAAAGVPNRPLNPMPKDSAFSNMPVSSKELNLNFDYSAAGFVPPPVIGPSNVGATPVFELPAELEDEGDEDDEELAKAIAMSMADATSRTSKRYTLRGTNIDELSVALERSKIEV
jgi:hypothetical protein